MTKSTYQIFIIFYTYAELLKILFVNINKLNKKCKEIRMGE